MPSSVEAIHLPVSFSLERLRITGLEELTDLIQSRELCYGLGLTDLYSICMSSACLASEHTCELTLYPSVWVGLRSSSVG